MSKKSHSEKYTFQILTMEVLLSLILSLAIALFLLIVIVKTIVFIIKKIVWLVMLPFRGKNSLRSHEEMRSIFKKQSKNKFHSKIMRSNSPGLSGLWHQLLIRVNFDIPTAERLVNSLRVKHPGKSDRWYIEKAIWNIERDRRN